MIDAAVINFANAHGLPHTFRASRDWPDQLRLKIHKNSYKDDFIARLSTKFYTAAKVSVPNLLLSRRALVRLDRKALGHQLYPVVTPR